ncbi:alpha/beta fold hydrolase [Blastococcus deserti]|uniref:Alpha/beta fold hydrolase n=1 Tax=Blastococcus deserti TaxID=2259033 RepID=A0ABW4X8J0_9ACTN
MSYAEFGDPDGVPVLNCHGAPSSRRERYFADGEDLRRLGVRLIGIDRPGFGGSDPAPGRRIVDWPADAVQLLDALALRKVRVLALSAGVPYALALARALPDRVDRVAAIGASPPPDVPWPWPPVPSGIRSLVLRPGRVSTAVSLPLLGPAALHPPLFSTYLRLRLGPPDRELLDRPEVRSTLDETFSEGLRQGWQAGAYDRALLRRPWGFPVSRVPRPVLLWHGRADWQAPLPGARLLAAAIPTARLSVVPGAGHFLGFTHGREILGELTAG